MFNINITRMLLIFSILALATAVPNSNFDKFSKLGKGDKRRDGFNKQKEEKHVFYLYTDQPGSDLSQGFLALARDSKWEKVKLKLIDCVENKYYCEDQGVLNFPWAKYELSEKVFNYTWAHNLKDYTEFIGKMSRDPVINVFNTDNLADLSAHPVAFILYYNPEVLQILDTSYIEQYKSIARQYKATHAYFGICQTGTVSYMHGLGRRDLPILMQLGADEAYRYNVSKNLNRENMAEFIENHKCLMKIKVSESNLDEALDCFDGKIVALSFLGLENPGKLNPGHANLLIKQLRDKNDFRFQFASVNLTSFSQAETLFGLKNTPSFALIDFRGGMQVREVPDMDLKDQQKVLKMLEKAWEGEDLSEFGIEKFESKSMQNEENEAAKRRKERRKERKNSIGIEEEKKEQENTGGNNFGNRKAKKAVNKKEEL